MAKKKRQSVEKFREFVKLHPHLRNEVKQKQTTWQELFEEWYLLGDTHPRWDVELKGNQSELIMTNGNKQSIEVVKQNKEDEQNQEWIGMLLGALKSLDINQIQQYITSANQAIGTIQSILEMFQGNKQSKEDSSKPELEERERKNPFQFRKD